MKEVYLDNSATTKPLPEVINYMTEVLTTNYGNPSSLHNKGLAAEKILKEAREEVSSKLGVKPAEIFFTSGGTESNNLAIKGIAYSYQNRGKHFITTQIEHASVLETYRSLEENGFEVTYLKPDKTGHISLTDLKKAIRPDTILVSIIHVNNELGTIHPIKEIGKIIKDKNKNTFFHVDGVQSFGKILLSPAKWNIDLLSISGHKIHGPKGTGILYLKKGIKLLPLINGGGQEKELRSGTENVPGIAGIIPAVRSLPKFTTNNPVDQQLDKLKNYFREKIIAELPQAVINSPEDGAPHILSLSFPGLKGEVLIHSLEADNIFVSTGSACHSRNKEKSHVLRAINLPNEYIDGTIRISFSRFNREEELNYTIEKLAEKIKLFF